MGLVFLFVFGIALGLFVAWACGTDGYDER